MIPRNTKPDVDPHAAEPLMRLRNRVVRLERGLSRLERSVSRQTEDLLLEMDKLIEDLAPFSPTAGLNTSSATPVPHEAPGGGPRRASARPGDSVRKKSDEDKLLGELASRGVGCCEVSRAADGTWWVRVDDYDPFTLSPALGRLLEVLCLDNGASDDHLIGWKSVGEVARLLRKRAAGDGDGRTKRKLADSKRDTHCVRQGLYRLRQALLAQQMNHRLVMVSRPLGVRFGVRHRRGDRDGR